MENQELKCCTANANQNTLNLNTIISGSGVQCVIFSLCLLLAMTKVRWQGRLGAVHPNLHLHLWHPGGEGCFSCLALSSFYSQIPHKVALLKMMASGTKGDLAMFRVAVWAFCCMLPQFVIAIIALGRAFRRLNSILPSYHSCLAVSVTWVFS